MTPIRYFVTLPEKRLLEELGEPPAGIEIGVWDLRTVPVGVSLDDVQVVVLPYLDAGSRLGSLASLPALELVQTQTTGYDGVVEAVAPHVAVATASGVHAAATAELALGLTLASLRGIDEAARDQREELWQPQRRPSLADRKVLLVGVGGIGEEIARRLDPFEVQLSRVGRTPRDDARGHVHGTSELASLAAEAEVLIVITPLTEETTHLIDADVLASLPDGALVVNVARGPVVDSDALTAEVVSGRLHCAIDVFDPEPIPSGHPLWQAPNALITPHVGGNTSAFEPRIRSLLRRQLVALSTGQRPRNLVQAGAFLDR
ncbi:2-hydroxyacid dehydrogenase [Nocardioides sp. 616]|uniref:2-hydroxyacid dehydrogenase n=1 Tax=Nocardioides sp. 616 TaxID=2268090 RepID=UPI000CE55A9A|nr:2-hydroxyacid dehydrogenase [Nocardioides sp. 616]